MVKMWYSIDTMRILYTITKSEEGGAQTHVSQLVRHFRSCGDVVGVMSVPGGWLEHEVREADAFFYPNSFFSNSLNPIRLLRSLLAIRAAVRIFKPDIIHCHSSVAGFLTRIAVRNSIPTIFTAHGWGFDDYLPAWKRRLAAFAEYVAARYASRIVCVSESTKDRAIRHRIAHSDRFVVIYNGIETDTAQRTFVAGGTKKIIFVGRLASPKEPEILLEAYALLPQSARVGTELLIVGDGPQRSALEALADYLGIASIRFLGSVSHVRTLELIRDAFVLVLVSKSESFGLAPLEAMHFGVPVIVSDVGGLREVVDSSCGILVPPGDAGAVAVALEALLSDSERASALGEAGKRKVQQQFSLNAMLRRTDELYRAVL